MATAVDERGRIVIPRDFREEFGFTPGHPVIVERAKGGVLVRPALPMREALARLRGVITKHARRGPRLDPLKAKEMWTEKLPPRRR